jgi:uroporphyrinogen-III decarboxylase
LIDLVGKGGGFILSWGCTVPVDCMLENLKAMVDTAKACYPH